MRRQIWYERPIWFPWQLLHYGMNGKAGTIHKCKVPTM